MKNIKTICVYSDVHSNLIALKSLMKTQDYKKADLRIFLGDIGSMCPWPSKCVSLLKKSGDIALLGNHDSYAAYGIPEGEFDGLYTQEEEEKVLAHLNYMGKQIKEKQKEEIKNWPKDYSLTVNGKKLYFTHYAWETENSLYNIRKNVSAEVFKKVFNNNADIIVYGHEHKPEHIKGKKQEYVGVGSLGMKSPGNYVMLHICENSIETEYKKLSYNVEKLKRKMRKAGYPQAEFIASWF